MESEYKYTAFISYRHTPLDEKVAKHLHTSIENYHIPAAIRKATGKKRMGRVFRDQEELPLSQNLGADIEQALKDSEWLVVVCSPRLLQSQWCMREIDIFLSLGRKNRILAVLAEGEPDTSFPAQIRFEEKDGEKQEIEPLAADLRTDAHGTWQKKLKTEKLRLLAPMLGVTFDDLKRRARERRLKLTALALGSGLLLSTAFTLYALEQKNIIAAERDIAEQNRLETQYTTVKLLVERSARSAQEEGLPQSAAYALEAYAMNRELNGAYDAEVSAALAATLYPNAFDFVAKVGGTNRVMNRLTVSPDGRYAAALLGADELTVFDLLTMQKRYAIPFGGGQLFGRFCFSADGLHLLVDDNGVTQYDARTGAVTKQNAEWVEPEASKCGSDIYNQDGTLHAIDDENLTMNGRNRKIEVTDQEGKLLWEVKCAADHIRSALCFFGEQDEYLLVSNENLEVFDSWTGKKLFSTGEDKTYGYALTDKLLLVPYRDGGLVAYCLPAAAHARTMEGFDSPLYISTGIPTKTYENIYVTHSSFNAAVDDPSHGRTGMKFSPDERYMTLHHNDGFVEIFDLEKQGEPISTLHESSNVLIDAAFLGDKVALCGYGGNIMVYDITQNEMITVFSIPGIMKFPIAFSPDGNLLIVLDMGDNAAYVLDISGERTIMRIPGGARTLEKVGFTLDGRQAVAVATDGTALVAELLSGVDTLANAAMQLYGTAEE